MEAARSRGLAESGGFLRLLNVEIESLAIPGAIPHILNSCDGPNTAQRASGIHWRVSGSWHSPQWLGRARAVEARSVQADGAGRAAATGEGGERAEVLDQEARAFEVVKLFEEHLADGAG